MTEFEIGKKALITTSAWFYAPDGKQYRAVFGTVKGIKSDQETLGIKTNNKSSNWYLEIGNTIIAGCQIHYAIATDSCNSGRAVDWSSDVQNGCKEYERPCAIYFADDGGKK